MSEISFSTNDAAAAYEAEKSKQDTPDLDEIIARNSAETKDDVKLTPEPEADYLGSIFAPAGRVIKGTVADVAGGVVESPKSALRGVTAGAAEFIKSINELGDWLDTKIPLGRISIGEGDGGTNDALAAASDTLYGLRNMFQQGETNTGKIVEGIAQFLGSAGISGKVTKALGVPPGVYKRIIDGFLGGATGFDPNDPRLSNTLNELLPNPVAEFLMAEKEDPALLGRLKSGIENAGLGVVAEAVIGGVRVLRSALKSGDQVVPKEYYGPADFESGVKVRVSGQDDVWSIASRDGDNVTVTRKLPDGSEQKKTVAQKDLDVLAGQEKMPKMPEPEAPSGPAVAVNDNLKFQQQARQYLSGEIPDSPIKVNIEKFEGPDQIKEEIAKLSKLLPEDKVISQEDTLKQATELGISPEEFANGISGQIFDRRQIAAGWMMVRSSTENLISLAQKAKATRSPEDVARFNAAFQLTHAIMLQVKGQSSEIARALNIHKALRRKDAGMLDALEAINAEMGGSAPSIKIASMVADLKDPSAGMAFIKQTAKAKNGDGILFAYSNVLMSNPATQVVNIADTFASTLWRVPETWAASKISSDVAEGEATALLFGLFSGVRGGIRYAARTIKTGKETFAPSGAIEIPGRQNIVATELGAINDNRRFADYLKMALPTNLSKAGDQLLKVINYQGARHQLAYRHAVNDMGLSGAEARDYAAKVLRDAPDWLESQAVDEAIKGTYNEPLKGAAAMVSNAINRMAVPVPGVDLSVPFGRIAIAVFIRTPYNILRWTMSRTPMAFLAPSVREDIMAGGARRATALGRIATGTAFMATLSDAVMSGSITGAGPSDPRVRARMFEMGWRPYSIKWNGKYYSYNRSATIGGLIGIAADATEMIGGVYAREKNTINIDGTPVEDSAFAAVVVPFAGALINKRYMQQFANLIEALGDPRRYGDGYGEALVKSWVPAVVGAVERAVDPQIRIANDTMSALKSKIPGLSSSLAPKRGLWGQEIKDENGIWGLISPVSVSTERIERIDKAMKDLGMYRGVPSAAQNFVSGRFTKSIVLEDKEYSRFLELAGNELKLKMPGVSGKIGAKDYLNAIVSGEAGSLSRRYNAAMDETKASMINSVIGSYRKAAKQQIRKEFPEIEDRIQAQIADLKERFKESRGGVPQLPSREDMKTKELDTPQLPSLR